MTLASKGPARPGRRAAILACLSLCTVAWSRPIFADTTRVTIENFTFSPPELTVAPGTTVTWTNADDIPHTVAATDKAFRSKPLDSGDVFSFTFKAPGSYAYFCSLHPHMVGRILVKAR